MTRLSSPSYLAFPFRVGASGPVVSDRARHIREQIEQVLFTDPGERVFRPDFGAGVKSLIFEPNDSPLWELARQRLTASLAAALHGEVDPRSLGIEVAGDGERLEIHISYTLATLGLSEQQSFLLGAEGGGNG
ncbi:MAG: GPW/gp25 family protein [Acidobacteriota bacterium]